MGNLHKGKHVFVDIVTNNSEICMDDEKMLALMVEAAKNAGSKVISQMRYHFGHNSPPGFAALVMLDESHISCHAYGDTNQLAMDFFTCGNADPEKAWNYMYSQIAEHIVGHSVSINGRFTVSLEETNY